LIKKELFFEFFYGRKN